MKIIRENVKKDITSCNFCSKGELNFFHNSLIYPYEEVNVFKRSNGNGLSAAICDECLEELYQESKKLKAKPDVNLDYTNEQGK